MTIFSDRKEAGRILAEKLDRYVGLPDLVVLALPRGGVPVAVEVAARLKAPLDVFLVRKLGVPGHEELAMGAIASGGVRVFNSYVIQNLNIPSEWIDKIIEKESREIRRRDKLYRGDRPQPAIAGRSVILIDDGLATGASMRAAVQALKQLNPARIIVAVPVAAPDAYGQIAGEVDEMVCVATPEPFFGVGYWYDNFPQLTDREVCRILQMATVKYAESRQRSPQSDFKGQGGQARY